MSEIYMLLLVFLGFALGFLAGLAETLWAIKEEERWNRVHKLRTR